MPNRAVLSAAAVLLLLTGCGGGDGGPAAADTAICDAQADDLSAAQDAAAGLVAGTALVQDVTPVLEDALTTFAGWVPEDERLDRAVTRAKDDVQTLLDDVQDQRLETQVPATAQASMTAIGDVCGDL